MIIGRRKLLGIFRIDQFCKLLSSFCFMEITYVWYEGKDWMEVATEESPSEYLFPRVPRPFRVTGNVWCRMCYLLDVSKCDFPWPFDFSIHGLWVQKLESCLGYLRWFRWGDRGMMIIYIGQWPTERSCANLFLEHMDIEYGRGRNDTSEFDYTHMDPRNIELSKHLNGDSSFVRYAYGEIEEKFLDMRYWYWGVVHPKGIRCKPYALSAVRRLRGRDPLLGYVRRVLPMMLSRDYRVGMNVGRGLPWRGSKA